LFHAGAGVFVRGETSPNPFKGGASEESVICKAAHDLIILHTEIVNAFF
jgi:hypothetical protein